VGALGGVTGAIRRYELVVGSLSGGGMGPTVLRSTRNRSTRMEVALNV